MERVESPQYPSFLGFVELPQVGLPTSLVSPWMKNGNGLVFCKNNPHTQRMPIVSPILVTCSCLLITLIL